MLGKAPWHNPTPSGLQGTGLPVGARRRSELCSSNQLTWEPAGSVAGPRGAILGLEGDLLKSRRAFLGHAGRARENPDLQRGDARARDLDQLGLVLRRLELVLQAHLLVDHDRDLGGTRE